MDKVLLHWTGGQRSGMQVEGKLESFDAEETQELRHKGKLIRRGLIGTVLVSGCGDPDMPPTGGKVCCVGVAGRVFALLLLR